MPETVICPACGKIVAVKGIPKHTNGCPKWNAVIGVPPSQFNFDRCFGRNLYAKDLLEGENYVVCKFCPDHRAKRLADHLKCVHQMTLEDYQKQFPEALTCATDSLKQRKTTVKEKFGVDNVAKAPEIQVLLRENNRSQDLEARNKRKATNLTRYGHENPFGNVEVQEKIKKTLIDRYGEDSPQRVPEIRDRTLQTCSKKYGTFYYFKTDSFKQKFKEVSLARFGAAHPMKSEKGLKLWNAGVMKKYGVVNPLLDADIWKKSYDQNLANHGGKHSQQCPEILEKARQTWIEKYGTDNPSKVEEIKEKIKETWMGKYGVPFPPQSLWTNQSHSFPNGLERSVQTMCPVNVVYAGDGSYWVRAPGESKARNPDFVVLTAEQLADYQNGTKLNNLRTFAVVEAFGTYWHGPEKTGKDRETHKLEVLDYYSRANLHCLILWEDEVNTQPKETAEKLRAYLEAMGRIV
jgi:hypothetical protein